MAELLLELLSEEIPASMQFDAAERLREGVKKLCENEGVEYNSIEEFYGSRRIAIIVRGLPTVLSSKTEEKRGPRVGAPENAVERFAASAGLTIELLEKRETPKGEFYFAVKEHKEQPIEALLLRGLQELVSDFQWPKSMRWGTHTIRWVRPLQNILCVFDEKVLPIKFGHLQASNLSYGHRFMANKPFEVVNFDTYTAQLKEHHVVLSAEERKRTILEEAQRLAGSYGVEVRIDEVLLNEVTGLVEWPVPVIGKIEERFLALPDEVLIASMKNHQKYFTTVDKEGRLAPYFIAVANTSSAAKGDNKIVQGFERVLRARLQDAQFFWDADRKTSLEARVEELSKVIFHAKLGTLEDKVKRMATLAKFLSMWVPHANLVLVEKAALLSKTDLMTEMVHEFPELQGLMGGYYALENGEDPSVATAIEEHYLPTGASSPCPTAPLSVAVSLSDKIDTLVGLFLIGEKPTGSKDPFALRRAALGVIRIILENNLRVPLNLLFTKAVNDYPKSILKSEKARYPKPAILVDDLVAFTIDRLKVLLKKDLVRHDYIQAVFSDGGEDDLVRLIAKVQAMDTFLGTAEGAALLAAYKRANNIVAAEQKKRKRPFTGEPDVSVLEHEAEIELFTLFQDLRKTVKKLHKAEDFQGLMQSMVILNQPVDAFFEHVVVNCENDVLKKNRMRLLAQFVALFAYVGDFSNVVDD